MLWQIIHTSVTTQCNLILADGGDAIRVER